MPRVASSEPKPKKEPKPRKPKKIPPAPGCETCGLFKVAQTHCIFPERDTRSHAPETPTILVLGSYVRPEDDRTGTPIAGRRSGGVFLRQVLNETKSRWVLSTAVRCFAGFKSQYEVKKPGAPQIRECVSFKLPDLIRQTEPAVVVLLGEIAMRGVLGKSAPNNMSKAVGTLLKIEVDGREIPVLVGKDPSNHEQPDQPDLVEPYIQMFERADEIAASGEGYVKQGYQYTIINSAQEFAQLAETLTRRITWDYEFIVNDRLPRARTYWHPDAAPIQANISEYNARREKVANYIIPSHLCRRTDLWDRLLSGRELVGYNSKTEIQAHFIFTGRCVYDLMPKDMKINGRWVHRDGLLVTSAQDAGQRGISMKAMAQATRHVDDWSLGKDAEIRQMNVRIKEENDRLKKNVTTTKKRLLNARTDEERERFLKELVQVEKEWNNRRPEGSAHFGDVTKPTLCEYGAGDGEENTWLDKYQEENGWEVPYPLDELQQRMLFITSKVEREGIPVDPKRFSVIKKAYKQKYLYYVRELLKYPAVRNAIRMDKELRQAVATGRADQKLLYKRMSPKRTFFLRDLARELGMLDRIPLSKDGIKKLESGELATPEAVREKGLLQINEDVLIDLSGGEEDTKEQHRKPSWTPWAQKTDAQKIWAHIYANRQLADVHSKFIKPLTEFTTNNRLRTDYRLVAVTGDEKGEKGGTVTGRLASADTNLQNLKKDPFLRWVFSATVYGEDWLIAESDYDRGEPVCLTAVAKIAVWQKVFENGWDLYEVIANEIYDLGISLDGDPEAVGRELHAKVPKELRENAKTRTLAIMYDESPRAFARRANITIEDAEKFYRRFAELYPEVNRYKEEIRFLVRAKKMIYTPFNRKRMFGPLPPNHWRNYKSKLNSFCRQAINFPIQSMLSDILLWKAYAVYRWLEANKLLDKVKMVNLVHDAIWFAMHKSVAAWVMPQIQKILEDTQDLPVELGRLPLRTGWKVGRDVGGLKEVERGSDLNEAINAVFQKRAA